MKNCILTPTYEGHFKYMKTYLTSFCKYVEDYKSMPLAFVLSSRDEMEAFAEIIKPYKEKLDFHCYSFEDILQSFGIVESSEVLLKKYGHISYQTLKKLYSMLYIEAERFFVLDSEASWITNTNMANEFENFFQNPYLVVSDFETRQITSDFLKEHFEVSNYIFGRELKKMPFEHFVWFYEKKVIESICSKEGYGEPYDIVKKVYAWEMETKGHSVGLMEVMLLLTYIYDNKEQLGYKVVQAEKELIHYMGNNAAKKYMTKFFEKNKGGNIGIIEFPCMMLTRKNWKAIGQLFCDYHIFITRCDDSNFFNYRLEKKFIRIAGIKILAVNQNHAFLPDLSWNKKMGILLTDTYKCLIIRVKKWIKKF